MGSNTGKVSLGARVSSSLSSRPAAGTRTPAISTSSALRLLSEAVLTLERALGTGRTRRQYGLRRFPARALETIACPYELSLSTRTAISSRCHPSSCSKNLKPASCSSVSEATVLRNVTRRESQAPHRGLSRSPTSGLVADPERKLTEFARGTLGRLYHSASAREQEPAAPDEKGPRTRISSPGWIEETSPSESTNACLRIPLRGLSPTRKTVRRILSGDFRKRTMPGELQERAAF